MPELNPKPKERERQAVKFLDTFTEWSLNWVPDSMVFVLALTGIVFFMAWGLTSHGPLELIDDYQKGFWMLLSFAMQMCLLMITGFVIADARLVKRGIIAVVEWPKTARSAVLMLILVGGAVSWLHWGVGLMLSIVMGREIAARKQGLGIHYPYIAAVCYGCGNIFSNGPTQAAPLILATPGHFLERMTGIIPITVTSFAPFQLILMAVLFISLPLVMLFFMPKRENAVEIDPLLAAQFTHNEVESLEEKLRPAERWERSWVLQTFVAMGILFWLGKLIVVQGIGKLDLNSLNFGFIGLGLLLHGSPHSFTASVRKGVGNTYGVIMQFPLYAGIFGMISSSGLAAIITHWFVAVSGPGNYAWVIFLYTGFMDFFVPSAGSKFVIEAPYIIPAAQQLGVPVPQVILAYCAGSQWANNLQPFWALPVLAAFRVRFQDILPFTFIIWLWVGFVCTLMFLLFPKGI